MKQKHQKLPGCTLLGGKTTNILLGKTTSKKERLGRTTSKKLNQLST